MKKRMKLILSIVFIHIFICSTNAGIFDRISKLFYGAQYTAAHNFGCFVSPIMYPFLKSENHHINYLLFTPENKNDPCDLQPTEEALKKCKFNPKRETKVLLAGYTPFLPPDDLKFVMKDKYLEYGDYNVVVHNWTAYNDNRKPILVLGYIVSTGYSFYAGFKMAAWIKYLEKHAGADARLFHLLGQSTGGAVASYAGKTTCNLGRITFLDAAAVLYRYFPLLQPRFSDAIYTDEIHCSGGFFPTQGDGYVYPIADIDYYMNDGRHQPKCKWGNTFRFITQQVETVHTNELQIRCNHYSVYEYYIASFNKKCKFYGLICDSYDDFTSGKCARRNPPRCEMGYYAKRNPNLPVHSKCYIKTSQYPPFCLNRYEFGNL